MEMALPTVKIKNAASASGFAIINEADFDPDVHELAEGEPEAEVTEDSKPRRGRRPKGE